MKHLIIGNGIAGISAAAAIREIDKEAEIRVITKAEEKTYYRPRITELFSNGEKKDSLYVYKEEWYREKKIEVVYKEEVLSLECGNKKVVTAEREYGYDKLLIATGAEPFIPELKGVELQSVFSVRELKDIYKIKEKIEKGRGETVVAGGGLLGLEIAGAIAATGEKVTVIEIANRLLPRQLDNDGAEFLKKVLENKGINFIIGEEIAEITGEKGVNGIKLKNGVTVRCNSVIFSSGIKLNSKIAALSGIKVNRGVVVDSQMMSSVNDVYAAGDIAEYNGICYGLWLPAKQQGESAGKNMAGVLTEYKGTPLEARMRVCGISFFSAGNIFADGEVLHYENQEKYIKAVIAEGKLAGAIVIGSSKDANIISRVFTGTEALEVIYKLW